MRILLTRPEAPALALRDKLEALGHRVALAPVLSIVLVEFSLQAEGLSGIVLTSASAAPALGGSGTPKDMPVYAIGGTSAEAARREGFDNVIEGDGDRRAFTALIAERHDPATGHLLHLAGSHRAGDIVAELQALGLPTERLRVYEAVAASSLPSHIPEQVKGGEIDVVLFFSPRSAETFVSLAEENGFADALAGMTALCLSDAVAEKAGAVAWKNAIVAGALNETAMIAALGQV